MSSPISASPARRATLTTMLVAALAVAGCSGTETPAPAPAPPAVSTAATSAAAVQPMDAKAVIDALAAAGLPVSNIAAQDENTDPNNKIGRPGGVHLAASADVPGGLEDGKQFDTERGMVVEVFATVEDADARSKYILDILKSMPMLGLEYHYRPADRRILVRITGTVKPSVAKPFEAAVAALKG